MADRKAKRSVATDGPSLKAFRQAAEKFTRETTATPEAARDALIKQGILTPKTGKLTKRYAPVR